MEHRQRKYDGLSRMDLLIFAAYRIANQRK